MIEREECEGLSVRRQCEIVFMNRSSFYYEPVPVSAEDKVIMYLIDEIYTAWPFYGARKISLELKDLKIPVGRRRTGSLMRLMGLEAVFPKKEPIKASSGSSGVSVSVAWCRDHQVQSGLEHGHYVREAKARVCLSLRRHRLAQPVCVVF